MPKLPPPLLDPVDRALVEALSADARISNARLAERVGIAPSTALTRLRALLAEAVADESIDRQPELSALLHRLARELCGEPPMGDREASPDVARVA